MSGTAEVDQDLVDLQARWSPAWKIWRARHMYDPVPQGSYCASRMDDSAGITPFLMSTTPKALHIALEAQAVAAESGATSAPEPPIWP
jgi:hypothetical protein